MALTLTISTIVDHRLPPSPPAPFNNADEKLHPRAGSGWCVSAMCVYVMCVCRPPWDNKRPSGQLISPSENGATGHTGLEDTAGLINQARTNLILIMLHDAAPAPIMLHHAAPAPIMLAHHAAPAPIMLAHHAAPAPIMLAASCCIMLHQHPSCCIMLHQHPSCLLIMLHQHPSCLLHYAAPAPIMLIMLHQHPSCLLIMLHQHPSGHEGQVRGNGRSLTCPPTLLAQVHAIPASAYARCLRGT